MLSRYERARMPHNISVMLAMEALQHLFQSDNLFVRLVRNIGLNSIEKNNLIKKIFIDYASGKVV